MREMRISKEEFEVQLEELRKENAQLKTQVQDTRSSVIEASRPRHTVQEKLVHGLFADNLSPKSTIEQPFNEDLNRKRQFSWDLYRKLMEDVHSSPIDDKTFNTAHDHLIFFRLPATIRQAKDEFKVEADKPFKAVDARGKLRAVELLEQTAAPFVPLHVCVGSWDARLMFRGEKKSSATPSSVQEDVEADNDSASEEQDLNPPSSPVKESDSSGERKMTKKAN